ncbi:hypothetical protein DID88_002190 [Monilinia fructigena]|uniref:Uncharacterized protein n=1 Tax=Monilinia fructigena TaxID=38457 RepID=A0A395IX41_9HELO|nr:hypothetical protein DID88_002190 [Monilinia fructigena]
MSLLSSFRALPPRTRAMIGASFLAWGTIGLYLSDTAEKKLGFEPTEQDKARMPRFTSKGDEEEDLKIEDVDMMTEASEESVLAHMIERKDHPQACHKWLY